MPELIRQQSIGTENGLKIEKWRIEVDAVNEFNARQRARIFARRLDPTIRNIMSPEVEDSQRTQTTFNQLFPESLKQEEYQIDIVVVRD